jgi:hypothetical protein
MNLVFHLCTKLKSVFSHIYNQGGVCLFIMLTMKVPDHKIQSCLNSCVVEILATDNLYGRCVFVSCECSVTVCNGTR